MRARAAAKELVYGIAHLSGVPALGRRRLGGSLVILTYHSFGPAEEHPYLHRLPVASLTEQLAHLARHFEVVGLDDGLARLGSGGMTRKGARPMVAITVDDGYSDNYYHLYPALRAGAVPATIFLATDYLDTGRLPWPTRLGSLLHFATARAASSALSQPIATPAERAVAARALRQHLSRLGYAAREAALQTLERDLAPRSFAPLPPLTWDQVREMRAERVVFGAHTHYHGWLDRLLPQEVERELVTSRERIESETGAPCRVLAYPNGNWTDAIAAAAGRAGFAYALTQDAGVNRASGLAPLALKRIQVPFDERIGSFACRVGGVAL